MTDPIADMLTRMRNAQLVRKSEVVVPYSKLKANLANILKEEGYIVDAAQADYLGKPALVITLKYSSDGTAVIRSLKRISKPGRRVYSDKKSLPFVLNNLGMAVISTSQGLMTNKAARQKKLGGEVLCEIF